MRFPYFLLLAALARPLPADEVTELLFYSPLSERGSYPRVLEMRIDSNGAGYVALRFKKGEPIEVRLELTAGERAEAVRHLREAAGADDAKRASGALRMTVEGRRVERDVGKEQRSAAWYRFLESLLEQGRCRAMLDRGRGLAEARAALEGGRIYQPHTLADPLRKVLGDVVEDKELGAGMGALARVTTPEAWSADLAAVLKEPGRRDYFLSLLASKRFRRNLPEEHAGALHPLLLNQVARDAKDWRKLEKSRRKAVRAVLRDLGNRRYAPAVPLLVGMLTDLSTDEKLWIDPALLAMGREAVVPLMHVCDDPRPLARRAAVTALERMVPRAPKRARGDKMVPTVEQRVFIDYLREACRRKLADLVENDPDASVRKAATRAAKRIEQGWIPPQR